MKRFFHHSTTTLSSSSALTTFVPKHTSVSQNDISLLQKFVSHSGKLLVLTGAGISTESGVPDYRSDKVGLYATSQKRPIQHRSFMESSKVRQSYWARNFVGWPKWSSTQPNLAHSILFRWESEGKVSHVITQNVDQLHFKAGSCKVLELHGTNSTVVCMSCAYKTPRLKLQRELDQLNPEFTASSVQGMRPDGDTELTQAEVDSFVVPCCPKCKSGILKPDVVFFGDSVPRHRVNHVQSLVEESDSILVVGSSLQVHSGYRVLHQASQTGKNIAIINIGNTRADSLAHVKISAKASEVLKQISIL